MEVAVSGDQQGTYRLHRRVPKPMAVEMGATVVMDPRGQRGKRVRLGFRGPTV